MTKKFCKQWGVFTLSDGALEEIRRALDGGAQIQRIGGRVSVCGYDMFSGSPRKAVKFSAALNKTRRKLHLIKQDLDADWARRVKERDDFTCVLCGVKGDKVNPKTGKKDVLTTHHWLKTKQQARMARWSVTCGVTVHYAEHIHTLHENPCWADLHRIERHVSAAEEGGRAAVERCLEMSKVEADEEAARQLWLQRRCWEKGDVE